MDTEGTSRSQASFEEIQCLSEVSRKFFQDTTNFTLVEQQSDQIITDRRPEEKTDRRKVWVCLFTFVAVRAIHLKIVADLSVEEILLALRRFIARWGKPKQIVLDNASQFELTKSSVDVPWENAIRDLNVQLHMAKQRIKRSFIVQLSPWMGGFYERLVEISKMALQKAIGKTCLTILGLLFDRNRSNC